MQIKDRKK